MRSGRGTARAEDAQGTPTQSHISPSVLVYEENHPLGHKHNQDRDSVSLLQICALEFVLPLAELAPARPREGNNLNGLKDFRLENGSSQGQNVALTVSCVPDSLDCGLMFAPAGAISQALAVTLNP